MFGVIAFSLRVAAGVTCIGGGAALLAWDVATARPFIQKEVERAHIVNREKFKIRLDNAHNPKPGLRMGFGGLRDPTKGNLEIAKLFSTLSGMASQSYAISEKPHKAMTTDFVVGAISQLKNKRVHPDCVTVRSLIDDVGRLPLAVPRVER